MEALQPGCRVDCDLEDLLGMPRGDLLDLHAALGRGHQGHPRGGSVDQHAEVQLAFDVAALFDIHAFDFSAGGPGLLRDEHVTHHFADVFDDIVDRPHDTDPAFSLRIVFEPSGAAAAGVDLRFDDPGRAAQLLGDPLGLLRGVGDIAARHRHSVPR
jgi:hypothetical protein